MTWILHQGDVLEKLKQIEGETINCCVTSPPYWGLRDYGVDGQLGLEQTPEEYTVKMVKVFREVRRVLRDDGTLWLNMGDSYASGGKGGGGSFMDLRKDGAWSGRSSLTGWKSAPPGLKHKDLVGIPWRLAFALQADGWYLRSDIIWSKPNPMPESVTDRPTKSHEYIFLLVKSPRYYYDANAIREPSTYLQPNSPESIKSPYGQGFTRRANNGVGFGHGTDKEMRERDTVRGSIGVIKNPLNSARRSGNKERKINVSGRLNTHVGSSIPWEGATRNKRTVWNIATKPFSEAHFAVFPPEIPEICIKAGCPEQGWVLDPFAGSGTTLMVAANLWRNAIGIEINPEYCELIKRRMEGLETNLFEMGGR